MCRRRFELRTPILKGWCSSCWTNGTERGDGITMATIKPRKLLVAQEEIESSMFTTWVADFKSAASQPCFATVPFLFSINIISYFIEFVNIFAQVRRYKIVTKTNRVEVWAFVSWDGWIRTSGMHGSGRWYWIMHQSKFLYYHRKPCALPLGYIPFSINIISYFIIFVKIFIGGSERIRTSELLSGSLP